MAAFGDDDTKLMEEMHRFEAEIADQGFPPPPPPPPNVRHIIGAKTFDIVQKKLEIAQSGVDEPYMTMIPPPPPNFPNVLNPISAFSGIPPPPPPPPPLLVPHQVRGQRPMPPMNRGLPPPPPHIIRGLSLPIMRPPLTPPKPEKPVVVLSAAPTKYIKSEEVSKNIDNELYKFLNEIKQEEDEQNKRKRFKGENSAAKMAESVKASTIIQVQSASSVSSEDDNNKNKNKKSKKAVRLAGGSSWEDPSLGEWEEDDFRIFCGDLGNDVTDEVLTRAFSKYTSFLKARVVRDKRTNKTKGYGFVSFKDPQDFTKAMKEMNGRYVGSRPIKLRKSTWRQRSLDVVKRKDKEKQALINILTGR